MVWKHRRGLGNIFSYQKVGWEYFRPNFPNILGMGIIRSNNFLYAMPVRPSFICVLEINIFN